MSFVVSHACFVYGMCVIRMKETWTNAACAVHVSFVDVLSSVSRASVLCDLIISNGRVCVNTGHGKLREVNLQLTST